MDLNLSRIEIRGVKGGERLNKSRFGNLSKLVSMFVILFENDRRGSLWVGIVMWIKLFF